MCAIVEVESTSTLGPWTRYFRLYLRKTRKEIARLAKVNIKDIVHLENNDPLSSEIRTRILKELYRIRVRNWDILVDC
jgi:hypothetical protein